MDTYIHIFLIHNINKIIYIYIYIHIVYTSILYNKKYIITLYE